MSGDVAVARRRWPIVLLALLGVGCGPDVTGLEPSATAPEPAPLGDDGAAARPLVDLAAGAALDGDPTDRPDGVAPGSGRAPAGPLGASSDDGALRTAVVVGDSLTLSAASQIEGALGERGLDVVAIDAQENRRIARGEVEPGVDAVTRLLADGVAADLWIVALGTNDVGAQAGHETMVADVDEILRALPDDASILWVDTRVEDRSRRTRAANVALRQVAAAHLRVDVVDWYSHAGEPGILVDDGVHLTADGRERFADVLADAVARRYTVARPVSIGR